MLTMVENLWAVGAPLQTPLGELTALHRPLAGGEGITVPPRTPPRSRLSASIFGPSVLEVGLSPMKSPGHSFALRGITFVNWIIYTSLFTIEMAAQFI